MRICLVAAENSESNLLLKNDLLSFQRRQWLLFTGEVDKSKITYAKFLPDFVSKIIKIGSLLTDLF